MTFQYRFISTDNERKFLRLNKKNLLNIGTVLAEAEEAA